MNLKLPPHLQHKVVRSSSPMEKIKKKNPLLPGMKKNLTAANLWKFIPDVK